MRVETRSHCSPAQRQFQQYIPSLLCPLDPVTDHTRVATKLLTQSNRDSVLKVGPTCFDDIVKLSRLPLKSLSQDTQAWQKFANNLFRRRNVNRRWEDVVRRLAHVHVVIRVNYRLVPSLPPEMLDRAIRDDLVHVHIRGSPATCLEDVNNELVVKSSLHYLLGRGDDSLALLRVQQSQLHVGPRSGELDQSHSPNEFLRKAQTRYWKVLNGALGLSAIIRRTRTLTSPMESLSNRYSSTVTIIETPKKARRTGTKKHSLSNLKIVLSILPSQFRSSLRSKSPGEKIRWTLISTRKMRRNSQRLRDQIRQVLSVLDEVEQYRMKNLSKAHA